MAVLLEHHADRTLVTNNGETPFDLAKAKNHEGVKRLLSTSNSQSLETTEAAPDSHSTSPSHASGVVQPLVIEAEVHSPVPPASIQEPVSQIETGLVLRWKPSANDEYQSQTGAEQGQARKHYVIFMLVLKMVTPVKVKAQIVTDNSGAPVEIPLLITEQGVLEPLLDYLLHHHHDRSYQWMERTVHSVYLLMQYMEANRNCFTSPEVLFQSFVQKLYSGTVSEQGFDSSHLYWLPSSTHTVNGPYYFFDQPD